MFKRDGLKWAAALVLSIGATLPAAAAETPTSLAGIKLVSADEVKKMLDSGVPVIDTRGAAECAEKAIKGAKSVPHMEKSTKEPGFDPSQDQFDLSKLPGDKSAPLVVFCNAGECRNSYKAAVVTQKAGYTKVQWFRGGFPAWAGKGLPTQ